VRCAALVMPLAVCIACTYERAPRSGPLARVVDSVFPTSMKLSCRPGPRDLFEDWPPHHMCAESFPAERWFEVGRWGRVLAVVESWPDDSAGQFRARVVKERFTAASGVAAAARRVYEDVEEVTKWQTVTVCYSLYRAPLWRGNESYRAYQASRFLPERFAVERCPL
jgi:hypothetical protein